MFQDGQPLCYNMDGSGSGGSYEEEDDDGHRHGNGTRLNALVCYYVPFRSNFVSGTECSGGLTPSRRVNRSLCDLSICSFDRKW